MNPPSRSRIARFAGLLLALSVWSPCALSAQEAEVDPPDTLAAPARDSLNMSRVSPGKAFLRSMIVPGWGQASVGSYNRAGFYFGVDAISAWMLLKTNRTLTSARTVLARAEAEATAQLIAEGVTDPQEIADALELDGAVANGRDLVQVRSEQKEDWFAFGIFMLFIGGADAFVAGHLADFPDALETEFRVTPDGAVEAGFSVKLPYH